MSRVKAGFAKLAVVAIALVIIGGFTRDARETHATGTANLFLSVNYNCNSSVGSQWVTFVNGPAENLYLCESNITDPYGASGFSLDFSYISWLVNIDYANICSTGFLPPYCSITPDPLAKEWLGSTGRVVTCIPAIPDPDGLGPGQGRVNGSCQSLNPPPPIGPATNAALAKITVRPGITKATTPLDFRDGPGTGGTFLVSGYFTTDDPPVTAKPIAATMPLLSVTIAPCADFTGGGGIPDHIVTIADILFEAGKFGQTSSSPGWNPNWDMDGNNAVGVQDILIVARQFSRHCPT